MRLAEQLETLARYLVEAQLEIAAIAKELEKESISKTIPQNAGGAKASWNPGPPRVLKIVVPIFLPKLKVHPQVTWRKNRAEATTYSAVRDEWFAYIASALRGEGAAGLETFDRAIVWIGMYFPDARVRDLDNYTTKFILDALVALGVLQDDNHSRVSLITTGEVDQSYPRTEVFVFEDQGQLEKMKPKGV
jgi:Holliday junction resolvase RusA-like endonuclease